MVGVAGSAPSSVAKFSAFQDGAMAMTWTSVRVIAGSATVPFAVLIVFGHDAFRLTVSVWLSADLALRPISYFRVSVELLGAMVTWGGGREDFAPTS